MPNESPMNATNMSPSNRKADRSFRGPFPDDSLINSIEAFSNESPMNATNIFSSNRKVDRVAKVKVGNGFTDPKYGNIPRSKRIHARHTRSSERNTRKNPLVICEEEKRNITSTKDKEIRRLIDSNIKDLKDERSKCTEITLQGKKKYNDLLSNYTVEEIAYLELIIKNNRCIKENQICNKSLKKKESKIAQLEKQCTTTEPITLERTQFHARHTRSIDIPFDDLTLERNTRKNSLVTCEEEKRNITSTKDKEIRRLIDSNIKDLKNERSKCIEITLQGEKMYDDLRSTYTYLEEIALELRTTNDHCIEENQICNKSLKEKESKITQLEEQCGRLTRYTKISEKPTTILELTQSTTASETTVKQTKLTAATSTAISEPITTSEKPTTILELTQSTTASETTVKQTKLTAATSTAISEPITTTEPKITQSTNIQQGIALIVSGLFIIGSLLASIFMFKKKRRYKRSLHLVNNLTTSQRQGHTQV
ncbi:hypothetical protein RHOW815_001422 [Candidatus Rhabdochlamydia sp. W815]|nr:hypothetical protein RHOW815_001422 [Candidatus Rhabdochlamydia sp. W815]